MAKVSIIAVVLALLCGAACGQDYLLITTDDGELIGHYSGDVPWCPGELNTNDFVIVKFTPPISVATNLAAQAAITTADKKSYRVKVYPLPDYKANVKEARKASKEQRTVTINDTKVFILKPVDIDVSR